MYGCTEVGGIASSLLENKEELKLFCVREKFPHIKINLKEGEVGELFVKSLVMFKRYLTSSDQLFANPTLANPFDKDGFYHTGDIARLKRNQLYILGRASTDLIRAPSRKVYAPAIENAILFISNIAEAAVLGIPRDEDRIERIAVLLKFVPGSPIDKLETNILKTLQAKLVKEKSLPLFMVPTLLRVLKQEEVMARSENQKINKVQLRKMFFGVDLRLMREDSRWEIRDLDD